MKKKSRNKSELNREQTSYESGIALTLDPDLLKRANVTQETMKEFEKSVPAFICRPPKKYVTCLNDDISGRNCVFVVFDFNLLRKTNEAKHSPDLLFLKEIFLLTLHE